MHAPDLRAAQTKPTVGVAQLEDLQLRLDAKEHECREHRAAMSAQIGNAEARERSLAKVNSLLAAMNAKVTRIYQPASSGGG